MNAFISIGATGKPAHPREKQLITAGIVAGLLGILQVLAVGSLPDSWGPALAGLYKAGLILYGVVLVAVVIHLLSIHKQLVANKKSGRFFDLRSLFHSYVCEPRH